MVEAVNHWKAAGLDLTPILHEPDREAFPDQDLHQTKQQDHGLEKSLDVTELVPLCRPAIEDGEPVRAQVAIRNVNRTVGTILGHEVTKKYGGEGLPEGTIDLTFTGSAGQSFGAFVPRGITLRLEGDANDYVGKGLSGGRIVVRPDRAATFRADEQIIAGNVIAYGATVGPDPHPRRRGGAVLRAQLRRLGGHRGRRRPRLRVHDRRPGRRPRARPGATSRPACPAASPGCSTSRSTGSTPSSSSSGPVEGEAAEELEQLVRDHAEETGSDVAAELLADWPAALARFTEVMPTDYRVVLEAKAKAEAEGLSESEIANAMMEALHG